MNDEEMIKLVYSLAKLDEHRRKELAILLLSTTLNPVAVEQTAGFMVGIADVVTEEKDYWNQQKKNCNEYLMLTMNGMAEL